MILNIHAAATWALIGLIWTVQVVLYPLFGRCGREAFQGYHAAHMCGITVIVAPLMFLELGTAAWLVVGGERNVWLLASLLPLGVSWISTALLQVPLHKKLERGFDEGSWRKLVATNWWRTMAWTSRGVLLLLAMSDC